MTPLAVITDALAAYRLTRLATADTITQPVRDAVVAYAYRKQGSVTGRRHLAGLDGLDTWEQVVETDEDPPALAVFVSCRWCMGMWVSAGVVLARTVAPHAWDPVARGLAFAAGAALIAGLEDR